MTEKANKAPAPQGDEIDLGYLLAVVWDHKRLILTVMWLGAVIGICMALLQTPIYRADALLQVERKQSGAEFQFFMGQEPSSFSTQSEILRTRMILGQAALLADLELVVEPTYLPFIGKALVRYGFGRPEFAEGWASVWAGEYINVEELTIDPGRSVWVEMQGGNRYLLKDSGENILGEGRVGELLVVDNPRIELLIDQATATAGAEFMLYKRHPVSAANYLRSRFSVSERGRDSGILQLTVTGENPAEIVRSANSISEVYLVQNINRQAAEAESRLQFLEEQVPKVRDNLTKSEDQLNRYRATQESVDLSFETQTMLGQLVELERQLNELQFQETEMQQRFTRSHPSYQTLLDKKEQLQEERTRLEARVSGLPETQQQVLRLTRDVEVTQQIYMQMLNTMQELRIARAGTLGNVRILDEAFVYGPIAPQRGQLIVMFSVLGLVLGLILVALKKMTHRGIETVEQLRDIDLPVYATIPLSESQLALNNKGRRKAGSSSRSKNRKIGENSSLGGVLAWANPTDLSIEALRSLRTSLHFAMLESSDNRLMLTGPSPSVGKSFISANLAAVCAQSGQKVLLVDADMRKGHIHSAFGDRNVNGLSELLAGKVEASTAIRSSQQEGLDYLPRGKVPPNPSELLMHPNFKRFLEDASTLYDLVIVDTPPVLAVTDAAIVGKKVGTSLMVIRFQVNPPKEVERAMQQLKSAGVEVKGAILNAIEKTAATSYGYGYGFGYGGYNYSYKSSNA